MLALLGSAYCLMSNHYHLLEVLKMASMVRATNLEMLQYILQENNPACVFRKFAGHLDSQDTAPQ